MQLGGGADEHRARAAEIRSVQRSHCLRVMWDTLGKRDILKQVQLWPASFAARSGREKPRGSIFE